MYHQRANPFPDDWWGEKVLGLTRNTWMLIFIGVILAIAMYETDWDWVFGRR